MILRTITRAYINENALNAPCRKAEHAVAVQAERDCRRFIPSSRIVTSGRVQGNVITWDTPFARILYFGKIYVDPIKKVGGFPVGQDKWVSRRGTTKIRSKRDFRLKKGTSMWFTKAKEANLRKWLVLSEVNLNG